MRVMTTDRGSAEAAAASGSLQRIKRSLLSAEDHAAMFRTLVPWPALAESFDADVALLQRALAGVTGAVLEPMA